MGKLRVYWLKTLKKPSIYPLGNTPSAPSVLARAAPCLHHRLLLVDHDRICGRVLQPKDHLPHRVHPLLHRPDLVLLSQDARCQLTQPSSRTCGSFRLLPTEFKERVETALHVRRLVLQSSNPFSSVICLSVQLLQLHVCRILVPPNLSLRKVSEMAQLVKDDDAQGASVLHSGLQDRIPLFLARVVTNNSTTKRSALVGIKMMTGQLATSHAANTGGRGGVTQGIN